VFAHFAGHISENFVAVFELNPEGGIGKYLLDRSHHLNGITGHSVLFSSKR
jgi:hypothetical protein